MACSQCNRFVSIENKDFNICATCNRQLRDVDRDLYPFIKAQFLQTMVKIDKESPIDGTIITEYSDVHHMKGRIGYADEWARNLDISLLIDVRFFLACSRNDHTWIEQHREEAEAKGYTLTRGDTHNG